jgi:hypothetical protein
MEDLLAAILIKLKSSAFDPALSTQTPLDFVDAMKRLPFFFFFDDDEKTTKLIILHDMLFGSFIS